MSYLLKFQQKQSKLNAKLRYEMHVGSEGMDDFEDLKEIRESQASMASAKPRAAKKKKQVKFDESIESSIYEQTLDNGDGPDEQVDPFEVHEPVELPFVKSMKKKEKPAPPKVPAEPYYKMAKSANTPKNKSKNNYGAEQSGPNKQNKKISSGAAQKPREQQIPEKKLMAPKFNARAREQRQTNEGAKSRFLSPRANESQILKSQNGLGSQERVLKRNLSTGITATLKHEKLKSGVLNTVYSRNKLHQPREQPLYDSTKPQPKKAKVAGKTATRPSASPDFDTSSANKVQITKINVQSTAKQNLRQILNRQDRKQDPFTNKHKEIDASSSTSRKLSSHRNQAGAKALKQNKSINSSNSDNGGLQSKSDLSQISYAGSMLAQVPGGIDSGGKGLDRSHVLQSSQTSLTAPGLQRYNNDDLQQISNSKASDNTAADNQRVHYQSHQAKMHKLMVSSSRSNLALSDKEKFLSQSRDLSENLSDHQIKMRQINQSQNQRNTSYQSSERETYPGKIPTNISQQLYGAKGSRNKGGKSNDDGSGVFVSSFVPNRINSDQSSSSLWDGQNGENSALSHFVNKKRQEQAVVGQNFRYGHQNEQQQKQASDHEFQKPVMGGWVKSENHLQKFISPAPSILSKSQDRSPFEVYDILQPKQNTCKPQLRMEVTDGAENFAQTIEEPSWQNLNNINQDLHASEHSSDITMPIDSQTEAPEASKKVPQKKFQKMPQNQTVNYASAGLAATKPGPFTVSKGHQINGQDKQVEESIISLPHSEVTPTNNKNKPKHTEYNSNNRLKNSKSSREDLIKFNMEDFKDKILGAMNSTNKTVKETLSHEKTASQIKAAHGNRQSMVVAPLSAEPVLPDYHYDDHEPFSEQHNYELNNDFYKSNTDMRKDDIDEISNSEVQFKVTNKDPGEQSVHDGNDSLLKYEREIDEITRNSLSCLRNQPAEDVQVKSHVYLAQPGTRQGAQGQSKIDLRISNMHTRPNLLMEQQEPAPTAKELVNSSLSQGQVQGIYGSMLRDRDREQSRSSQVDEIIKARKHRDSNVVYNSKLTELIDNQTIKEVLAASDFDDEKIQKLISEFEMFELKHNSVGSLSQNEEFMMKIVKKLSQYVEQIQTRKTQAATSASTLTSFSDARVTRLQQQITEMGLEYQCQKTQVETLQKFNSSLTSQVQQLEHQLLEAQHAHLLNQKEKTPRQSYLQDKIEQRKRILASPKSAMTTLRTCDIPLRQAALAGEEAIREPTAFSPLGFVDQMHKSQMQASQEEHVLDDKSASIFDKPASRLSTIH